MPGRLRHESRRLGVAIPGFVHLLPALSVSLWSRAAIERHYWSDRPAPFSLHAVTSSFARCFAAQTGGPRCQWLERPSLSTDLEIAAGQQHSSQHHAADYQVLRPFGTSRSQRFHLHRPRSCAFVTIRETLCSRWSVNLFLVLRWVPQPQRLAPDAIIGGSQRFLRGGSKKGQRSQECPKWKPNCAIPRYLGLPPLQCQVPFRSRYLGDR